MKKTLKEVFSIFIPSPNQKDWEWIREMLFLKGDFREVLLEDLIQFLIEIDRLLFVSLEQELTTIGWHHLERNNARKEFLRRLEGPLKNQINKMPLRQILDLQDFVKRMVSKESTGYIYRIRKLLEENEWTGEQYEEIFLYIESATFLKLSRKRMPPIQKLSLLQKYFCSPKSAQIEMLATLEKECLQNRIKKHTQLEQKRAYFC
jgi:hypothetical protein